MVRTLSRRALLVSPLLAALGPSAAGQTEQEADEAGAVPMFRGNPARTGENPGPGPVGELASRWQVRLGKILSSSPAVVDGVVYIGSVSPGNLTGGALHAVEAATGIERWRLPTVPGDGIFASPAVVEGVVAVGSYDGIVVAAEAATGEERWRFQAETSFFSSPAIVDGVVYLGDNGGRVYALGAAGGEERWRFVIGDGFARSVSSPAVVDGAVYCVGTSRRVGDTSYLHAFDAATGEERWRFAAADGGTVRGTVVVVGDQVYVLTREGFLYAVDAGSGAERARFDLGFVVETQAAIVGGVAYLAAADGELHAIDAETGEERWSRRLTGGVGFGSSPIVADGTVYAGDRDGIVYAVEAASGDERWQARVGSLLSSPAIVGGLFYVGSNTGYLRAVGDRGKHDLPSAAVDLARGEEPQTRLPPPFRTR